MITLIQNADVYAPRHLGMRDVLLEGGKIALIAPCGEIPSRFPTLQTLIFRTGNGHHFFRVACLHFSVFHANIIPQNTAKSQCFQWFPPISPAQTVVNPVTGR